MNATIATIIGARPQFIKAAPVSRQFSRSPSLTETIIHTGQHYDRNMSEAFFAELGIPAPAYNLGVGSGSHGAQTGEMLIKLEPVIREIQPNVILVYGDTNSTLAGALTAAKMGIPLAHVEAGLRSYNRRMPEEINRVLTDHTADILFCPTRTAVENLKKEGITTHVHKTGDVMYDAALLFAPKSSSAHLQQFGLKEKSYILLTIHRAENTDNPARLTAIFSAMQKIAAATPVLAPLHPRTLKAIGSAGVKQLLEGIQVIEPQSFVTMAGLEKSAKLIVTDSGGVQKEAYFHRVLCLTLRDETEWVETVASGWNRLVRPEDAAAIVNCVNESLQAELPSATITEYGDGSAAHAIVDILMRFLQTLHGD